MSTLELVNMTSKGKIIIPHDIRENLHLVEGAKFILEQDGNTIILKPIYSSEHNEFEAVVEKGDRITKALKLKPSDIDAAKKAVRLK